MGHYLLILSKFMVENRMKHELEQRVCRDLERVLSEETLKGKGLRTASLVYKKNIDKCAGLSEKLLSLVAMSKLQPSAVETFQEKYAETKVLSYINCIYNGIYESKALYDEAYAFKLYHMKAILVVECGIDEDKAYEAGKYYADGLADEVNEAEICAIACALAGITL